MLGISNILYIEKCKRNHYFYIIQSFEAYSYDLDLSEMVLPSNATQIFLFDFYIESIAFTTTTFFPREFAIIHYT